MEDGTYVGTSQRLPSPPPLLPTRPPGRGTDRAPPHFHRVTLPHFIPLVMDIPGSAPLSIPPHAEENVQLVRRCGGQAACDVDPGHGLVRRELVLSESARCHAAADVAGAAGPGLPFRAGLHAHVGRRRHSRLRDRLFPVQVAWAVADAALRLRRQDRMVPAAVPRVGRLVHPDQGPDADPVQARHHRVGLCACLQLC